MRIDSYLHLVYNFQEQVLGLPEDLPLSVNYENVRDRRKHCAEELDEVKEAVIREELPEIIDGWCDLAFIAFGGLKAAGLTREEARTCLNYVAQYNLLKTKGRTKRLVENDAVHPAGVERPEVRIARLLESRVKPLPTTKEA